MDTEKRKEYLRQWAINNREKCREKWKRWKEKNSDRVKAIGRACFQRRRALLQQTNPQELERLRQAKRDYDRVYRETHKEERSAYKADPSRRKKWNAAHREKHRQFREQNPLPTPMSPEEKKAHYLKYWREWGRKNRDKKNQYYWRKRERILAQKKVYADVHRKQISAQHCKYRSERCKRDPAFRLLMVQYTGISRLLRGTAKCAHTMELIGCSRDELRAHLESKFQPGMTWENYGPKGWHVDHIWPTSKVDFSDPVQQRMVFNYKNLQPLWAKDNILKSNKLPTLPLDPLSLPA